MRSRSRSAVAMATIVTIEVVAGTDGPPSPDVDRAIQRALDWFDEVERTCSRFLPASEAMRLSDCVGRPTRVSPLLFEAVRFALAVADASAGAYDPTVGAAMAARGFDREHRSGQAVSYAAVAVDVTYRDVALDAESGSITLARPLVLDLGGVAKGLAVDMAARELEPFRHFAIDAGGDLYLAGRNTRDEPWSVGIRHPREDGAVIETMAVTDCAVCTSGDYERRQPGQADGHHLLDPRTGGSADTLASVTVRAPTAIVADALATAAFVLGARDGLAFLERQNVQGLFYAPDLVRTATAGF